MSNPDGESQLHYLRARSVPVTVDGAGVIARTVSSIAWIDHIRLYSTGVLFDVSLITVSTADGDISMQLGWREGDEPSEVETWVRLGPERLPVCGVNRAWPSNAKPVLHAAGVSYARADEGARAQATWWLNVIPSTEM